LAQLGSKQEVQKQHNSEMEEVFELYLNLGYTLREAAEEIGVKLSTLKTWAWEADVSFAKDTNTRRYLPNYIDHKGKQWTVKDLAAFHGLTRSALSTRLRNGWTLEAALKQPIRAGNYMPRKGKDKSTDGVDTGRLWLRGKL